MVCALQVKGFPTLYFVSGKDGKVHSFGGERTVEGMEKVTMEKSNAGPAAVEAADDAKDTKLDAKDEL